MDTATAKLIVINRRAMRKLQRMCDERDLPYPPELIRYLTDLQRYSNVN